MKILFLSDIHGSLPALKSVLNYYDANRFELLVLLGDILNYGPRNGLCKGLDPQSVADCLNNRKKNIICVRGNCDSEVDQMLLHFPIQATYTFIVDKNVRFFVTHGHIFNEKKMPEGPNYDVFVYGHTHLCKLHEENTFEGRTIFLNTGSPTFPKNGNPPTFATWDGQILALRTLPNGDELKALRIRE